MQTNLIQQALGQLTLSEAQHVRNLSVYPLLAGHDEPCGYLTLDEALRERRARVNEVSDAGHVPELAFENLVDLWLVVTVWAA